MQITRGEIITRGLTLRCPNCGKYGLFKNWFRLHKSCQHCAMPLEKEQGFYLGTTSIGYVLALFVIVGPVLYLAVTNTVAMWLAITLGFIGTLLFSFGLYPCFLSWVIMFYYCCLPQELPGNNNSKESVD